MSGQQGGFSLFPSPNSSKPPSVLRNQTPRGRRSDSRGRRSESRERRAPTPQTEPSSSTTPLQQQGSQFTPPVQTSPPRNLEEQQTATPAVESPPQQVQPPAPAAPPPIADENAAASSSFQYPPPPPGDFDELVHASSVNHADTQHFRRSIAKLPLYDENEPVTSSQQPPPIRSIFPTYNHQVPLTQQEYAPTQLSPTRIPRAVISRDMYHHRDYDPSGEEEEEEHLSTQGPVGVALGSPGQQHPPPITPDYDHTIAAVAVAGGGAAPPAWPRKPAEPPAAPNTCTTEQLRSLWKVANGWKAAPSEGRVYCLRLIQEKDAPVYNLSSSSGQPFYNMRLDPTSASAYVTVARYDPAKQYKAPRSSDTPSSSTAAPGESAGDSPTIPKAEGKHWQQCIATTLEEESRRLPPEDGLVALLMPTPATKVALEKADDPHAVMLAQRECGRLVWDEDSSSHYLVHPALATPFCVTVERSPAWSRVEYTLEHHESPQHVAKLTREGVAGTSGTGTWGGWLEVDTAVAAQIDSFYMVDVAVTALMLVAAHDEKNLPPPPEAFEPPPGSRSGSGPAPPGAAVLAGRSWSDRAGASLDLGGVGRKWKQKTKIEAMELDLESQESWGKGNKNKKNKKKSKGKESELDKLPFVLRAPAKVIKAFFKVFIWILTIGFKCVMLVFRGAYSCVGSKY